MRLDSVPAPIIRIVQPPRSTATSNGSWTCPDSTACARDCRQRSQRIVAPPRTRGPGGRAFDQRVVRGDEDQIALRRVRDHRQRPPQGSCADPPLRPVPPPLRARGRLQRDDRHAGNVERGLDHLLDCGIALIRREEPAKRIPVIGDVVIADFECHRHAEAAQPIAATLEFAAGGAHRQVAGHHHRVRALGSDAFAEPRDRGGILGAEMHVADMKEPDHDPLNAGCREKAASEPAPPPPAPIAKRKSACSSWLRGERRSLETISACLRAPAERWSRR